MKCPVCGDPIPASSARFGRYREYCSSRCKQRAYRRRQAGARLDTPPIPGSRLSYPLYEQGTHHPLTARAGVDIWPNPSS